MFKKNAFQHFTVTGFYFFFLYFRIDISADFLQDLFSQKMHKTNKNVFWASTYLHWIWKAEHFYL